MAEKYPLINGCIKSFTNGEPMVITAWSDSQRGTLLLPEDFWRAALEWAVTKRNVKAIHLECERVGVDLFLNEDDDPDCVRHVMSADLTHFLTEWIPPHRGCANANEPCGACWREETKARRYGSGG